MNGMETGCIEHNTNTDSCAAYSSNTIQYNTSNHHHHHLELPYEAQTMEEDMSLPLSSTHL